MHARATGMRAARDALLAGVVALAAVASCKGGSAAPPPVCGAGEKTSCACAGGTKGSRTCLPDLSGFGACGCSSGTGTAGTGGSPPRCTEGQTMECTCASGDMGTAYCYASIGTFSECSCPQKYVCRNRKGLETCAGVPVDLCGYSNGACLLVNQSDQSCTTLSTAGCSQWDTDRYCAMFPLLCEWVPVGRDGGVASEPIELPDGGFSDGPADDAGGACTMPATDGGADGGADGGIGASCGALEATGPCVSLTESTNLAPRPVGGTLVAGTYELVALKAYGPKPDPSTPRRQTLVVTGTGPSFMFQTVFTDSKMTARATMKVTPVSNLLLLEGLCPTHKTGIQDYTATGDTLLIYEYQLLGVPTIGTYQRR